MTTVVRRSSSSSAFQSSSKTVTTTSSSSKSGSTRSRPSIDENGFGDHGKGDSVIEEMLKEMSLEHESIMEKNFKGDADEMSKYYESSLQTDFLEDSAANEVLAIEEANQKPFELQLDLKGYTPEEVKVTTKNNMVNVEAKHEEKQGGQSFVAKQFSRKFSLPTHIRGDNIKSSYDKDGVLKIMGTPKGPRRDSKTQETTTTRKLSGSDPVNSMLETMKDRYQTILDKYFHGDIEAMMSHYESILKKEFPENRFMPVYMKSLCKRTNTSETSDEGVTEFEDKFEIKVDVHEFTTTEVNIRTYYNYVIVEGRACAKKNTPPKIMKKRYQLPTGFDSQAMTSKRSKDGIMTIIVPKRRKSLAGANFVNKPVIVKRTVRRPSNPSTTPESTRAPRCAACAKRQEARQKAKN